MNRRLHAFRGAGVVLIGASLVFSVAPGVAGASRSAAGKPKGPIACTLTGTLTASPPLSLGSGKATTLTLSADVGTCTGSAAAAKITGGTVTGKSVDTSASCVGLENGFPALAGKVKYKTSGRSVGRTALAFSGGTLNMNATPLSITFPKPGGKGVAKHAFATKKARLGIVLSETYSMWVATCQAPNGLSTMTLAAGSTLTA
jgi:hypothetical protein